MPTITSILMGFFSVALVFQGASNYRVVGRYPVPGDGGFDYVTLDSSARRLYLSHATQVDVVDADTGKVVGTIPDTPGIHGVALAPAFKHGFTSNGRENKVSMFDPSTLQLIKKIDVGKGPDGIYYDPGSKRVFTNNHGSHDVTAIGVAKVPTGLAYDAKTKRLFIGCRNEPKMVVMDATTGKVINSFPIGANVDYAGFDPGAGLVFFSCGDGTLSIYREKSADSYEDAGAVKTQPSAKTMAFDPKTKKIFLPAAEYLETPATEPGRRPQRTLKPGSFGVLVVGKS